MQKVKTCNTTASKTRTFKVTSCRIDVHVFFTPVVSYHINQRLWTSVRANRNDKYVSLAVKKHILNKLQREIAHK